jgi:hypothetical protein
MEEDSKGTGLSNVIRIDDERVREHLGHIVRGTVEETSARRPGAISVPVMQCRTLRHAAHRATAISCRLIS